MLGGRHEFDRPHKEVSKAAFPKQITAQLTEFAAAQHLDSNVRPASALRESHRSRRRATPRFHIVGLDTRRRSLLTTPYQSRDCDLDRRLDLVAKARQTILSRIQYAPGCRELLTVRACSRGMIATAELAVQSVHNIIEESPKCRWPGVGDFLKRALQLLISRCFDNVIEEIAVTSQSVAEERSGFRRYLLPHLLMDARVIGGEPIYVLGSGGRQRTIVESADTLAPHRPRISKEQCRDSCEFARPVEEEQRAKWRDHDCDVGAAASEKDEDDKQQ